MRKGRRTKKWPEECAWPEPVAEGEGYYWDPEDADLLPMDEDLQDLMDIKGYMDDLVEEGILDESYQLVDGEDWRDEEESDFTPRLGEDYWEDGFDLEAWEEDVITHLNLLKLPLPSPVAEIQEIIGYEFANENLLRQAFTRRAFAKEYDVGDSEELEFLGDTVLNTIVTNEIVRQVTDVNVIDPARPFRSRFAEGELTKLRECFINSEYLSERARLLSLDRFILYGRNEEPGEHALEDMMEALIGAVAVDCKMDQRVLEEVTDRLVCVQLMKPDDLLRTTYYELFNVWHQRRFKRMPSYEVDRRKRGKGQNDFSYTCTLRFSVPENDRGIPQEQRVTDEEPTRSAARERAAFRAYCFVVNNGLWMNLSEAHMVPDAENSINQLQELYQKKYLEAPAEYYFEPWDRDEWQCSCVCNGIEGWGRAGSKTKAKKAAAYQVLQRLFRSGGEAS